MQLNLRLEVSPLAAFNISGVGNYTRLLSNALAENSDFATSRSYLNFLNRQPTPNIVPNSESLRRISFPLRIYNKMQSYGVAPPFDLFLPPVDLTLFTNFATWPTIHSKLSATVIHDLSFLHFPETVDSKNLRYLKRVVPHTLKKADFIITVSESVKNELVETFNLNPDRCIVTPIPPDPIYFKLTSLQQINLVKEKYGINRNKKYIYFIGNREPRKNLTTLLNAYRILPEAIKSEYDLVLAGGKGWKSFEVDSLLEELVNKDLRIHSIGYVDQSDSPALYQGAALTVLPSLYEGFGMPITEAFACGCPVVASDIPVFREVGGEYIVYADPRSSKSFADKIEETLSHPPSHDALKNYARQLSWSDNVGRILSSTKKFL